MGMPIRGKTNPARNAQHTAARKRLATARQTVIAQHECYGRPSLTRQTGDPPGTDTVQAGPHNHTLNDVNMIQRQGNVTTTCKWINEIIAEQRLERSQFSFMQATRD